MFCKHNTVYIAYIIPENICTNITACKSLTGVQIYPKLYYKAYSFTMFFRKLYSSENYIQSVLCSMIIHQPYD